MALLIKADGTQETYPEPANGTDYKLAELKAAIGGGYIEMLALDGDRIMVLDEEGKLKGFPVNREATRMTRGIVADSDLIVGDVLVCRNDQVR